MPRVVRLALLAAILVAILFVTSAAGSPSSCTYGVSSVGPAVLIHGRLASNQSDLVAHTEACLPR